MQNEKEQPLKGRARDIYLDLCQLMENLPVGCSLPSLRELQRKYSAGQQTVVNVLKFLDKNNNLERIPRKKIKVSAKSIKKTISDTSFDVFPWISVQPTTDTILATTPELASVLQPIVDRFNINSPYHIRINAVNDLKSIFVSKARGDFAFFGNNPVLLGLIRDTSMFMDLGDLTKSLDVDKMYEAAFIRNPEGYMWGISPTLAPPVIFHNRNIDSILNLDISENWKFSDFARCLEELRKKHSGLPYIYSTVGYVGFLSNWGVPFVNPATGRICLDIELLYEPLAYLKRMVASKVIPVYSEIFNMGYRTLFNQRQVILRDDWINSLSSLPDELSDVDVLAFPSDGRNSSRLYSEVFSIMADSMNYDRCWHFIAYMLSEEIQQYLAGRKRDVPVLKGIKHGCLTSKQTNFISRYIEHCERKLEDYYLPQEACYVLEVGIDRWIRYGTELTSSVLKEIERSCQWHIDNIIWR